MESCLILKETARRGGGGLLSLCSDTKKVGSADEIHVTERI